MADEEHVRDTPGKGWRPGISGEGKIRAYTQASAVQTSKRRLMVADLSAADLSRAGLARRVHLDEVHLSGADLSGAHLSQSGPQQGGPWARHVGLDQRGGGQSHGLSGLRDFRVER